MESVDYKLDKLATWLLSKGLVDANLEAKMLKIAITLEDAVKDLNSSPKVSKIIKAILWEEKEDTARSDLPDIAERYKEVLLNYVPNDLSSNEKGLAVRWLARLGGLDKDFSYYILREALKGFLGNDDISSFRRKIHNVLKKKSPEESLSSLRPKLETYFHFKRFMSENDIMKINTLNNLYEVVDNARSAINEYKENKAFHDWESGTEKIYEDEKWEILGVHNKGAACHHGKPSNWCTASPGLDFFSAYYHPQDPLFVVKDKEDKNNIYQVHYGKSEITDVNNERLSDPSWLENLLKVPGVQKYLGPQLYSDFKKIKQGDFEEEEFLDFSQKLQKYLDSVIADKKETREFEPDGWLPSIIFEKLETHIEEGLLDEDASMDAAAMLFAKEDPSKFFSLGLAPDYPEQAKAIVEDYFYNEEYNPLNGFAILPLLEDGLLFSTSEVEELFEENKDLRKHVADLAIRVSGTSRLIHSESYFKGELAEFVKEFHPNYVNDLVNSYDLDEENRFYAKTKLNDTKTPLWRIISPLFKGRFPEIAERIMMSLKEKLDSQPITTQESYAAIDLVKDIYNAGHNKKYVPIANAIVRKGLSEHYDLFRKTLGNEILHSKELGLSEDAQAAEKRYVELLLSDINMYFPGWRTSDYSGQELDNFDKAVSLKPFSQEEESLVKLHKKIIRLLEEGLRARDQSGTANKRVKISQDLLLFIVTFFPKTWDTYNMEYKVDAEQHILGKFGRSSQALEEHNSSTAMGYQQEEDEEEEDANV